MGNIRKMVVVKLLNGIDQITALNLSVAGDGAVLTPMSITSPVYNENRKCNAVFFKKIKNTVFYKEVKDDIKNI